MENISFWRVLQKIHLHLHFTDRTKLINLFHLETLVAGHHIPVFNNKRDQKNKLEDM